MRHFCLILVGAITALFSKTAEAADCGDGRPICSYNATNKSCTVKINRLDPITPPTIYVQRGCVVSVEVANPSPIEDLTLDWKSSATVIPPDTFLSAFSSISATLGKVTIVGLADKSPERKQSHIEEAHVDLGEARSISNEQRLIEEDITGVSMNVTKQSSESLDQIKAALQPIPVATMGYVPPWDSAECTFPDWPGTAKGFPCWQAKRNRELTAALQTEQIKDLSRQLGKVQTQIEEYKQVHRDVSGLSFGADLDANQAKLSSALEALRAMTKNFVFCEMRSILSRGAALTVSARRRSLM